MENQSKKKLAHWLRYIDLGLQFFVSIGLFTWLGVWLDRKLETVVLFTLLGVAFGFGVGMYSIYRSLFLRRPREDAERAPAEDHVASSGESSNNDEETRSEQRGSEG